MSKLDELLQGVDVELKLLGDVSKIFSGGTPNTSKLEYYDGNIPWIRSGEVNFNVITSSARNITKEGLLGSSAKLIRKNSVVLAMTGATVGRSAVVEFETSSNQSVAAIETDENIIFYKYLYYFLENSYIEIKNAGQGALTSLNLAMIKKFKIPIPCPDNPEKSLEIQQEIVRVLDELTTLTNQLTTELETERQNRKKQFEFFREQLFRFEEGEAELKNLKDVAKISNGKDHKIFKDGSIPVYGSGGIMRYIDTSIYEEESVLIPRKGSIGNIFYVNEPFWTVDTIFYTKINIEIIIPKYFYYFLKTKDLKELNFAGGVPSLTKTVLDKIKIPIPSLAEQERIVKLLDQFDATHTTIEEEITKEIKLRTQQYEYYRGKILSFPQN